MAAAFPFFASSSIERGCDGLVCERAAGNYAKRAEGFRAKDGAIGGRIGGV